MGGWGFGTQVPPEILLGGYSPHTNFAELLAVNVVADPDELCITG